MPSQARRGTLRVDSVVERPPAPHYEKHTEKELSCETEVDVPRVQTRYHKAVSYQAAVSQHYKPFDVEVTHRLIKETPEFHATWEREEVPRDVPRTIIREAVTVVEKPEFKREAIEEDVEIPCAPFRYDFTTPRVVVDEASTIYTASPTLDDELSEEVVEIPCIVPVPHVNLIERTETEEVPVPVEVRHVHRVEQPVEVLVEQVVEKVVDVPTVVTERVTRQKPVFVDLDEADIAQQGYRVARPVDDAFRAELRQLQDDIRALERERSTWSATLASQVARMNGLQHDIIIDDRDAAVAMAQIRVMETMYDSNDGIPHAGKLASPNSNDGLLHAAKFASPNTVSTPSRIGDESVRSIASPSFSP